MKIRITAENVDGYVEVDRGTLDAILFTANDNQKHMKDNYTNNSDAELKEITDNINNILNHIWHNEYPEGTVYKEGQCIRRTNMNYAEIEKALNNANWAWTCTRTHDLGAKDHVAFYLEFGEHSFSICVDAELDDAVVLRIDDTCHTVTCHTCEDIVQTIEMCLYCLGW